MRILWFTWKDRKNPYAGGITLAFQILNTKTKHNGQ